MHSFPFTGGQRCQRAAGYLHCRQAACQAWLVGRKRGSQGRGGGTVAAAGGGVAGRVAPGGVHLSIEYGGGRGGWQAGGERLCSSTSARALAWPCSAAELGKSDYSQSQCLQMWQEPQRTVQATTAGLAARPAACLIVPDPPRVFAVLPAAHPLLERASLCARRSALPHATQRYLVGHPQAAVLPAAPPGCLHIFLGGARAGLGW